MYKNIYKNLSLLLVFVFFLINTKNAQAIQELPDLTQPFEYDGYTINMPLILASDSILWELLEGFDTPDGGVNCEDTTEAFILANPTEMQSTFPWLWDDGDAASGASSFCTIMNWIPTYMAQGFHSAGLQEGTTNILDPSVVPNWHTVDGLVFDHPLARIEFTKRIDLLSHDFVYMVLSFANAFDANTGYLALNSDIITGLKNTGAIITFKNVPSFENPAILVDGVLNEKIISALTYDAEAKTVTFNTEHFTSFKVVERSSIPENEDEDDESEDNDKKRPKIYSAKIERLTYADGRDYYKVTAKGKNFDKDFNMYLGGRKSKKEVRVNKRKAIGYFNVSDFENAFQDTYKLKVYNSSKRKRTFDHELPIKNIPHQFMN